MASTQMIAEDTSWRTKIANPAKVCGGAVLLAALMTAGLMPSPSHAVVSDPVITSPAPGTVLPNRWDGSVTVDFRAAPVDDYWYSLECDDDDVYTQVNELHDSTEEPLWTISATDYVVGPATCEATVRGDETGAYASARWTVLGPSVTFGGIGVSQTEIFPVVRDGYADTVAFRWWMTADATVTTEVRDALGRLVKSASLGMLASADQREHSWTWDGLRQDGAVVTPGNYTLSVTATGADGISRTASKTVTASTGVQESAWKTTKRAGAQASKVTPKPGCLSLYKKHGRAVTLNCARGRGSVAKWNFTLPANAVSITYKVRGQTLCCTQDPRISSHQPYATRYEVRVKVLRGQIVRIEDVTIRYKVRTPI